MQSLAKRYEKASLLWRSGQQGKVKALCGQVCPVRSESRCPGS